MRFALTLWFALCLVFGSLPSLAQERDTTFTPDTLTAAMPDSASILYGGTLDAIVSTVSRTKQRLADAPAAMTVPGARSRPNVKQGFM